MRRRRFDHLVLEISLAVGAQVPRYPVWLRLRELGFDPEWLAREDVLRFCDGPLVELLAERGLALRRSALRRLRRAVSRFDPALPTPDERMARAEDWHLED